MRKRDLGFRSNEDEDKVIIRRRSQEARETTSVRLLFLKSFSFKYRFIALSLSHRKTTKHHDSDDDDDGWNTDDDDESLRADGKDNETKKQKRSDADDDVHRRRVFRVPGAAECARDHNGRTFSRFGVRETKEKASTTRRRQVREEGGRGDEEKRLYRDEERRRE